MVFFVPTGKTVLAAILATSTVAISIFLTVSAPKDVDWPVSPLEIVTGGKASDDQKALKTILQTRHVACAFGSTISPNFVERLNAFAEVLNESFPRLSVTIDYVDDISNCRSGTTLFIDVQDGPVSRRELQSAYANFGKVTGLQFDTSDPALYVSSFAQVFSLSVRQGRNIQIYGMMLLNQNSDQWENGYSSYFSGLVAEEWFQFLTLLEDIDVDRFPRSIVEEKFIPTPELWQGRFDPDEIARLSDQNPVGLCMLDIQILQEIYGSPMATYRDASGYLSPEEVTLSIWQDFDSRGFADRRCATPMQQPEQQP